jgi:CubicO group peptidase (beta-lactamase class C family)
VADGRHHAGQSRRRGSSVGAAALVTLASVACVAWSSGPSASSAATPGQRIDRYMRQQVAAREFSGAVVVAKNGRVVFTGGYGYADRRAGRRNSPTTLFRLAGFPIFNRLAVYQLRDRGRLDLADSVCRFVPRCPASWEPMTLASLLANKSGPPDLWRLRAASRRPPTIEQAVAWMKPRPTLFSASSPGRRFDDSPAPQVLLAYVIGRAADTDWLSYLRRAILRPAGMATTFTDSGAPKARRAVGYILPSFRPGRDIAFTRPDPVNDIWTTVGDLFRLDQAIYDNVLLKPSTRAELFPNGVHTVEGLHAYDRPQGHVSDGWFTILGHHAPDHVFVGLLMNGRKPSYRFYDIELQLAGYATGLALRRTKPVRLPRGPLLAVSGNLGVITVASVNGSDRAALTTPYAGYGQPAAWSPDGKRLAFNRCGGGKGCRAFVIDANGLDEHQVAPGYATAWAPDRRIVISDDFSGRLRLVSASGGRTVPPVSVSLRQVKGGSYVFSPDGHSLLYMQLYGPRGHVRSWLMIVDLTTGAARRLRDEPGFYLISSQAWSPDGTMIAFIRRPSVGSFGGGAYVVGSNGQGLRLVANGAGGAPAWSPDGQQLAFNLGISCIVQIVGIDGSAAKRLPFEGCRPLWRPQPAGG